MSINLPDWQTVVAIMIVSVAVIVLVHKLWRSVFGTSSSGCGTSCGSCPVNSQDSGTSLKVTKLIQLEEKK